MAALAWPGLLTADDYLSTRSVIDGSALGKIHGTIALNMAAGDLNLQSNAAAFALSDGGASTALVMTLLKRDDDATARMPSARAMISEDAFRNAAGLVLLNQSSGVGNLQANNVAIALAIEGEVLAESVLAATVSSAPNANGLNGKITEKARSRAVVSDSAFKQASGLVQLSQSAGSWNTTGNQFVLRVGEGAKPQ